VLKRFPGTFLGVCRVDPLNPAAPDHLSALAGQGFRGVRLSPAGDASGDWFQGPLMPPLWKRCGDLKIPMTVLAPITRMPDMALLLEKTPELTVVIDHMSDCPIDRPAELEKLIALRAIPTSSSRSRTLGRSRGRTILGGTPKST
jgi:predicted TIM-barrel fold metal-dependent hydrolase